MQEKRNKKKKRWGDKKNGGKGRMEMRSRGGEDEKKREGAEGRLSGMRGKGEEDRIAKAARERERGRTAGGDSRGERGGR